MQVPASEGDSNPQEELEHSDVHLAHTMIEEGTTEEENYLRRGDRACGCDTPQHTPQRSPLYSLRAPRPASALVCAALLRECPANALTFA